MVAEPKENRLWYVRREGNIRGPFPRGRITRDILLGRILDGDELSHDRELWKPLTELPQLLPEAMRHSDGEEARQRLLLARLREDERLHGRRGAGRSARGPERRHGDRRNVESFDAVARGAVRERPAPSAKDERNLLVPAAAIMIAAFILITYSLWHRPGSPGPAPDCQAPPAPGVDWNGCALSGHNLGRADLHGANLASAVLVRADLQGANLAGANLSDANLEAADLRGANLTGTILAGARLEKAIWTDGRVCAAGSVGECR